MTTYSTDYLTEWFRLADLTTQLEAVRDGVERDRGRQVDAFLAFEDDWASLVAEGLIDADLVAACVPAMERVGCGLDAAGEALERMGRDDLIRDLLTAGTCLPVSAARAIRLAGDLLLGAEHAPRLDPARTDPDDVIAWHVSYASRSWEHFAEAATWLAERDICLDDWDAPRYCEGDRRLG